MKAIPRVSAVLAGMTIGARLVAAFGFVLLFTAALGLLSIVELASVNRSAANFAERWMPGVDHAPSMRTGMLEHREFETKHARAAQGRGFAVVAAEVRSLAQRSAQAAREIKSLIATSVERGTTLVDRAGEAVSQMDRVTQQNAELAQQLVQAVAVFRVAPSAA